MASHIRAWGPAVAWAAVLFYSSSIPDPGGPDWLPLSDKLAHGLAYAVLGATLAWGWRSSGRRVDHPWLLAVGLLYGLGDEWHQMYVPGRFPDPADWLADAAGLVIGYGTTWAILGRTRDDPSHDDDVDTGDGS